MKKLMLFLSAVLALSLIAGCAFSGPAARPTGTPDSTTPTTLPTNPTTVPTDPTTVPPDPTTVPTDPTTNHTEPIITTPWPELHALLSSGWFNQALTSLYTESGEVDLYKFFYNGFPEESKEPTAEEWAELKSVPGFEKGLDLIRLPVSKMNEVLEQHFQRTLNNAKCVSLEKFTYLESTDCYYLMHADTDTNAITGITVTDVKRDTYRGTYVYYTRDGSDQEFCVWLNYYDNKYSVVTNQLVVDYDAYVAKLANLPEPEKYHKLFELVEIANMEWPEHPETQKCGPIIVDAFLEDPDTFIKYAALEEKGSYNTVTYLSLAIRDYYSREDFASIKAACKRVAEDPASTPDEQFAAFDLLWWTLSQEERAAYTLQELARRTPLDDYTVDTCIIEINRNGGGYAHQYLPVTWTFTSYEAFQNHVAYDKEKEYYDMTVTNTLCPKSFEQLAATYDAEFFEKNVLIRIEVATGESTLPAVTEVSTGDPSYWLSAFSFCLEYDETKNDARYVLFIAAPKKYYQPPVTHTLDCIINGRPMML